MGGPGILPSASLAAALIAATLGGAPARAALVTYDYTARLVDEIGPYDAALWGSTASGSFTIDKAAASAGGGLYPLALPRFTLATPTGISVAASMSLQLIDAPAGGG